MILQLLYCPLGHLKVGDRVTYVMHMDRVGNFNTSAHLRSLEE